MPTRLARRSSSRLRLRRLGLAAIALLLPVLLTACSSSHPYPNESPVPASVRMDRGIVFARPDGTTLRLDACTPRAASGDLPAVVLVHSGSWDSGDRTQLDWLCAEGAEHGFAAFTVDYRLLPAAFPDQLDDVASAISWIKGSAARFHVDVSRFTLLGTSAGGGIVAQLLTGVPGSPMKPSDFVGGAMLSGVYDFTAVESMSKSQREQAEPLLRYAGCPGGQAAGCAARLAALSPAKHVRPGLPPMFLANSTGELTPTAQPKAMASALAAAGVRHQLAWAEGGNHAELIAFYDRRIDAELWRFLESTVR